MRTPLSELKLTVRTEHILMRGRIYDVETLFSLQPRDIYSLPDIGKKTLAEINERMAEYELAHPRPKVNPKVWLATSKDGRVKYTTDSERAQKWIESGSYRRVDAYGLIEGVGR